MEAVSEAGARFGIQEAASIPERSANYSQDTALTEATC